MVECHPVTLTRHHWYGTFGLARFLAVLPLGLDGLLQPLDLGLDVVQDSLQTSHSADVLMAL